MNFLRMSPTENKVTQTEPPELARRSFNWIEVIVIPIATCLMEAQPVALSLILVSFPLTGLVNAWPLGEAEITLLLLGLRCWAMLIHELMRRGMSKTEAQPLQVLGLFLALGAMIITHLWFLENIGAAIVGGIIVVWFWQRGINVAQLQDREESFVTIFKIGFGVVLIGLIVTALTADSVLLRATAARIFTTFFLSGLLALSFLRLSGADNSHGSGMAQTTATRNWLFALTFVWTFVVVIALSLEAFSFQFIQSVLLPVWNFLGWVANALADSIGWLLSGLFSGFKPKFPRLPPIGPQGPIPPGQTGQSTPAHALVDGRLLLLLIAFALLILVVVLFLRRWNVRFREEDEEEVRESLAAREIVRGRQEEQRRTQQALELEILPPNSVRAQYRDLLQTMSDQRETLTRRVEETPMDYQRRLMTLLKQTSAVSQGSETANDNEILDELTHAYVIERYGNRAHDTARHVTYTHSWAERLAKRLSGLMGKEL